MATTPGPWHYDGRRWIRDAAGTGVLRVQIGANPHDARCAAAAPALLAALKLAESFMAGCEGDEVQEGIDEHLATTRARWWPGPPPGGNSREAVRVVCGRACDLVAAGLNRDRVPLHVGAVDAPPEAEPILTGRREAMPRVMDNRRYVTNRRPCVECAGMTTLEDGTTWCGPRGGAVAPSQRAQHPEGEPCFVVRPAT